MTDIPQKHAEGPTDWHLALPDWFDLDTVWHRRRPFALWTVGEQPLLFHWLDAAVDQGSQRVVLYVADRPADIRQAVARASLWPIEVEVRSVASLDSAKVQDRVDRLPGNPPLLNSVGKGWELIEHWFNLEQSWLRRFTEETRQFGEQVAIGRYCQIAPDVRLRQPYWIGDFVSIGPGSEIGPGTVIEGGSIVSGGNRLEKAHIGPHTYLGPELDLVEAVIHRNELLNLKHRARIAGLEAFLASGVGQTKNEENVVRPGLRERWIALRLYLRWRGLGYGSEHSFKDLEGKMWPLLQAEVPEARCPWLKLVWRGKMALFGIPPRPPEAIAQLPSEWAEILRNTTPGVFSYADVMGEYMIGSEEEALHCVYQATAANDHCEKLFESWLLERLQNTTLSW